MATLTNGKLRRKAAAPKTDAAIEAVREDISALREDLDDLASDAARLGREMGKETIATARSGMRRMTTAARTSAVGLRDEACGFVQRNPIASVAIAAGAGAIALGLLSRGRSGRHDNDD